jgi:solute carrier family 25 folate transporter 32
MAVFFFKPGFFQPFYKGLAPNLLRVVPATMITFLVYENVSHYMLKRRRSDSDQQGSAGA